MTGSVTAVSRRLPNRLTVCRMVTLLMLPLLLQPMSTKVAWAQTKPRAKRVVVVSWDGAADWVVDRLLTENKLPNVARLARMGVRAEYSTPAFPSKTACGHAALWTGAYGDINGVTGNSVPVLPRAEHTLLETRSGFTSPALLAEPLYVTAAKAGKKVLILSATQSFPPDPWVEKVKAAGVSPDRLTTFDGFESGMVGERVWDGADWGAPPAGLALPQHDGEAKAFTFKIADAEFTAAVYDDPQDPTRGFDTVSIKQSGANGASAILKPVAAATNIRSFSPRFPVTLRDPQRGDLFGYTYFRLFALDPTTGRMTLFQRGVNGIRGTAILAERQDYLNAYGGFHSVPFNAYDSGLLGKTLWQGGDGEAEKRLIEIIRLDVEFLKRGTQYALKRYNPDLTFHYTPMIDSAGHEWMGALDPDSPRYDAQVAAKLMPYYEQVYQLEDEWLGTIIDAAGKDAAICLVSDHGMAGVGKNFSPNAVFEKAGLLVRTADGKIDLTKTKICAPPWGDYLTVVNGVDWKGGIVTEAERESVLRQATDALLSARDPETNQPIVTRIFRPGEVVSLGIGGVSGGDLYMDVIPGYVPTSRLQDALVQPDRSPIGGGVHGFFPLRTKMQAIFYLGGAGIAQGKQIPGIRQIDMAPTISYLLGIPAPANAVGHIIGEAFAR